MTMIKKIRIYVFSQVPRSVLSVDNTKIYIYRKSWSTRKEEAILCQGALIVTQNVGFMILHQNKYQNGVRSSGTSGNGD